MPTPRYTAERLGVALPDNHDRRLQVEFGQHIEQHRIVRNQPAADHLGKHHGSGN